MAAPMNIDATATFGKKTGFVTSALIETYPGKITALKLELMIPDGITIEDILNDPEVKKEIVAKTTRAITFTD